MKCLHGLDPRFCAVCLRTARPFVYPRKPGWTGRVQSTTSIQALWSIPTEVGVLVICGVCSGIASEGEMRSVEHSSKLISRMRTHICKHCGQRLMSRIEWDYPCPVREHPLPHQRRWLIKAMKVAACRECAGMAEHEVESWELDGRIERILGVWKLQLAERGLL